MKVLVDGVVFEHTHQKGIRRYLHEVLSRTKEDFSIILHKPWVGPVPENWDLIQPLGASPESQWDILQRFRYRENAKKWREKIRSFNVFHSTWFRLAPIPGIPTVVTIYDMVTEAMPTLYWGDAAGDFSAKAAAIKAADAIITISETTKQDLLKLFPDIRVEVHAIPLGADHFEISSRNPLQNNFSQGMNNEGYALFVGDRVGYKNFHSLLEAMCQSEWPRGVRLKVAGPPFSLAEEACLRFMGLQDKVDVCGLVTNDDLACLYAGATAFVFPSLFEGFGLPLLEAQARHAPVIANDMPIFHEVGGNAFLPCDCRNPALIAKAVCDLTNSGRREHLIEAGLENVKRYSWAETARKTISVWESVARF
jgi:glycosyltransferase involved in cell wall biosynthesis